MRALGFEYFKLCLGEYGKALRMVGSDILEFYSSLDGLQDQYKTSPKFKGQTPPSFRCEYERDDLIIHCYSNRRKLLHFLAGTINAVSKLLFSADINIRVSENPNSASPHHLFYITSKSQTNNNDNRCTLCRDKDVLSSDPSDSRIGVQAFCVSFPFHVIFDRNLQITQLGTALMKMIAPEITTDGLNFGTYFEFLRPVVKMSFNAILSRVNSSFMIRTKAIIKQHMHVAQVIGFP